LSQNATAGGNGQYQFAKSGEHDTQVTAIGPSGLEYKETKDDPRVGG
jgi:hypothetical protein